MAHIDFLPRTQSPEPIEMYPLGHQRAQPTSSTPNPTPTTHPPTHWHPKLTTYRLLVIFITLGFSIAKAVLSYQGRSIVPITLEWLFGTGVFLMFFALDTYRGRVKSPAFPWFFEVDLVYFSWKHVCGLFGVSNPPFYGTEEDIRRQSVIISTQPPIRGYDLLVTSTTILFGMTKSVMAYAGYNTGMTTVEWIGSAVVGVAMYWLGLYESNPLNNMPYLFTTDYTRDIKRYTHTPIRVIPQVVVIALASWWSYRCIGWIATLRDLFPAPAQASETFFEKVMDIIVVRGFVVCTISLVVATLGASIFVVLVIVLSRFRLDMLDDNATFLGYYAAPIFFILVLDLSVPPLLLSLLITCISTLPLLASLEEKVISLVFIFFIVFLWILCLGTLVWWLGKFSVEYLSAVVRIVRRAVLRWYAASILRRSGSMGV
ncbi:hypothetical protein BDQ17DRAFT_477774 [Cyathus striatus]|nr:hypothetical protein BDQ17DRAFT_477774 [Cyathus striatus]